MASVNDADKKNLEGVKRIVLVFSGKGGVGKSTVSTLLALSLVKRGQKVGLLDIDLCGPSIPHMLGLGDQDVHQSSDGWVPVYADKDQKLSVMSIGFLLTSKDDAVVWRGPKKNAMIKQFLNDVSWGSLDCLIVDTPPGTSDEHITVVEGLKNYQHKTALVITTPQAVSVGDVRRELTFCKKTGLSILGVVENMSGFVCPTCSECSKIFSKGGGEELAKEFSVNFLGFIPIDPSLSMCLEKGTNFLHLHSSSPTAAAFKTITDKIVDR